jgi:hypothetical protein
LNLDLIPSTEYVSLADRVRDGDAMDSAGYREIAVRFSLWMDFIAGKHLCDVCLLQDSFRHRISVIA